MDEEKITSEQQPADQPDAFLAGWDQDEAPEQEAENQATDAEAKADEGHAPEGDGAPGSDKGQGQEATGAETPENAAGDSGDGKGTPDPGTGSEQQTQPTWAVKHMGAERVMGTGDITPELLQKGLDYDRIREKYDEAKPVMAMFTEFAKQAGMSVTDYAKFIRAEAKRAGGMSEADAKRAVDLEDREAAVSEKEAAAQEESNAKEQGEARVQADLAEFAKAFPDIFEQAKSDPKVIPQSVWADIHQGLSLTAAYSRYAVAKAQEEAKSAREGAAADSENRRNAERSAGSMQSAGKDKKTSDPFLEGFDG